MKAALVKQTGITTLRSKYKHAGLIFYVFKRRDGWYHSVGEFHTGPHKTVRLAVSDAAERIDLAIS